MNEDTQQENETRGRTFCIQVYGNTAAEIDTAALLAAQAFFGDDVPLEITTDYQASKVIPKPQNPDEKKYTAQVCVRAVT